MNLVPFKVNGVNHVRLDVTTATGKTVSVRVPVTIDDDGHLWMSDAALDMINEAKKDNDSIP